MTARDPVPSRGEEPAPLLRVPEALAGARADRTVALLLDVPVNAARRLIAAGRVRVRGRRVQKGDAVEAGDDVEIAGAGAWLVPGPDVVPRLFVDEHVIVVDKPAGMPCHPLVPGEGGTVVDALIAIFPEIARASEDPREAGLVHRLDTGTSGCLALARDPATWRALRAAFADDLVDKRYLALVHGAPARATVLDAVAHDPADPRRMRIDPGGRPARTEIVPLSATPDFALVDVRAHGGRRHQVRVHLASRGHPLVGDVLYGAPAADDAPWHLLHASALALPGGARALARPPPAFAAAAGARGLGVPDGGI